MKVNIEFEIDESKFLENVVNAGITLNKEQLASEIHEVITSVAHKVKSFLEEEATESFSTKIIDINGNTIGTTRVKIDDSNYCNADNSDYCGAFDEDSVDDKKPASGGGEKASTLVDYICEHLSSDEIAQFIGLDDPSTVEEALGNMSPDDLIEFRRDNGLALPEGV
jgi:hypothetical protein